MKHGTVFRAQQGIEREKIWECMKKGWVVKNCDSEPASVQFERTEMEWTLDNPATYDRVLLTLQHTTIESFKNKTKLGGSLEQISIYE